MSTLNNILAIGHLEFVLRSSLQVIGIDSREVYNKLEEGSNEIRHIIARRYRIDTDQGRYMVVLRSDVLYSYKNEGKLIIVNEKPQYRPVRVRDSQGTIWEERSTD